MRERERERERKKEGERILFPAVIPWVLESWANYKIEAFVDENVKDMDEVVDKEHAIVLMNHPGDLDWMVGWVIINRFGMLGVSPAAHSSVDLLPLNWLCQTHLNLLRHYFSVPNHRTCFSIQSGV